MQKEILQLTDRLPAAFTEIREDKIAEHTVKIVLVIDGNIPEHTLIATRSRRLVQSIHHVLQMIGDFMTVGFKVVITIVATGKVIEVGQKLNRSYGTSKLRADRKHKVYKSTAEAF